MPTSQLEPVLRDVTEADVPAILQIYSLEVRHGFASWEYEPPTEAEMRERIQKVVDGGYPFLVAEVEENVAGYAYASAYRPRPGYRFLVENSIYVASTFQRKGIARGLLTELIELCTLRGFRQMVAVIGDSQNESSIALHRSLGFEQVGLLPNIGFKANRWLDCVLMQRALGDGAESDPE